MIYYQIQITPPPVELRAAFAKYLHSQHGFDREHIAEIFGCTRKLIDSCFQEKRGDKSSAHTT